ncbi:MAG: large subunit ribosomal protein L18 [Candidatus Tokpelaia sp. JSC085]|nr:MAG: large subunit ribosomal protein L18 [Candidatus Tokpelaia sp. JSC085]
MTSRKKVLQRRAMRVRRQIRMVARGRLRLSVYRSNGNIYAQVIDDSRGHTIVSASTMDVAIKESLKSGADCKAAAVVGRLIAERAVKAGVRDIVFDRGPYIYHGRIKALAEAARDNGLRF